MKKFYFLILCFFAFGMLFAQKEEQLSKEEKERRERNIQAGNPFAKYGYKAKVSTLSKGKYLEVHDLDSVVTIGTMRWHVKKQHIVGQIVPDTLNPDAQPIGDRAGRWLSPDPLMEEFPDYSPYTFSFNNPVRFVDPDGRAPEECCDGLVRFLKKADRVADKYGQQVAKLVANSLPPVAVANIVSGASTGHDIYGQQMTKTDMGMEVMSIVPVFKIGKLLNLTSDALKVSSYSFKHIAYKNVTWNKIIESTKTGVSKFKHNVDYEGLTKVAWDNGTSVNNGKPWKVYKSDDIIGASAGKETNYMRVEFTPSTNELHSSPITKEQYNKLTKQLTE